MAVSERTKTRNIKSSRLRRNRGYHWEDTIVKRFNSVQGWNAFRLGSPSIRLPDVLAVSTQQNTIIAIEAKSGASMSLYVPADQIQRCLSWTDMFDIYKKCNVILAFKFLSKKRVGPARYENRELREFFKIWDRKRRVTDCYCTYDGKVFAKIRGKKTELRLQESKMPFETRQPAR